MRGMFSALMEGQQVLNTKAALHRDCAVDDELANLFKGSAAKLRGFSGSEKYEGSKAWVLEAYWPLHVVVTLQLARANVMWEDCSNIGTGATPHSSEFQLQ